MKKFFARFNFKIKTPSFENAKFKRCAVNFLQTNILLIFAFVLFALVTRPVALDVAEYSEQKDESVILFETFEGIEKVEENDENPFPFSTIKPQEGLDRRLTRAEMRWIFMEEIRLNAIKDIIDEGNAKAHKAFSAMTQDFNVRGANFKYEWRDKNRAQEDVDAYKDEIVKNAVDEARSYGWGKL